MDLDDLIEDLLPKKQLKKLKKKVGKKSLLEMIVAAFRWLFMALRGNVKRDSPESSKQQYAPKADQSRADNKSQSKHRSPSDSILMGLRQARQYSNNIEALALAATEGSTERMRLDLLSERVVDWIEVIEGIVAQAIDQTDDPLLAAEREQVPAAIKRLEKQLSKADDVQLKKKLERTLDSRRRQLAQLKQASNGRQLAELKVENMLAQLGIIYSQLRSGQLLAERSGYERLSAEITEEVSALSDYLHALDDITTTSTYA